MKRNTRKGFTGIELVIVIAIIAILAATLIPTFGGLFDSANKTADKMAVREMNTALMVDGISKPTTILELFDVLAEAGMSAEDYKPLAKDTRFFWDASLNRVLYVDKDNKVIFPEEHANETYTGDWFALTLSIDTKEPENYAENATSITVADGSELAFMLEKVAAGDYAKGLEIVIPADGVDMMGATFCVPDITKSLTLSGGTIKNATAIEYIISGDGVTPGNDGFYKCSLFGHVGGGSTLTLKDVTFENIAIKNTHTSNVALFVGLLDGTLELNNVTIKNTSVVGHRNTGALVGLINGISSRIYLSGPVNMENVSVQTVGGRSGLLIGYLQRDTETYKTYKRFDAATDTNGNPYKINMTNCTVGVYKCEQNTGSYGGEKLGLRPNDDGSYQMYSWAHEPVSNSPGTWKVSLKNYIYWKDTYVGNNKGIDLITGIVNDNG